METEACRYFAFELEGPLIWLSSGQHY